MGKITLILLWSFCGVIAFAGSGCASQKKMAQRLEVHAQDLKRAAHGNLTPQKKFDILAQTWVEVLDESMQYVPVRRSVRHVDGFIKTNGDSMDLLLKDFSDWFEGLSTIEKLGFAARVALKPYTRQLIDIVPKFERKVKRRVETFRFLSKVTNILKVPSINP